MKTYLSLFVASVVLAACGAPSSDAPASSRLTVVPEDNELHELLVDADEAWQVAGVAADRIVVGAPGDEGGVPVVWRSTAYVSAKCMPNGGTAIGCLDVKGEGLVVAFDAPRERLALIVRHELGHTLRDVTEQWHVSEEACAADRASATMCDGSTATEITNADAAFICDSETDPCE